MKLTLTLNETEIKEAIKDYVRKHQSNFNKQTITFSTNVAIEAIVELDATKKVATSFDGKD